MSPSAHQDQFTMNGVHNKKHAISNDTEPEDTTILTSIAAAPVTVQRQPYVPGPSPALREGGVPRANNAPTQEKPHGTTDGDWQEKHKSETVLQQHAGYFDPDGDGIIWPQDTYYAVRAWGWNIPLSLFVMAFIHLGLSYFTVSGLLPDPFFRLYIARMHNAKHGSSSMTYDHEGRFRPQLFEDIFAKYGSKGSDGLTFQDIFHFWNGQRMALDIFGATAVAAEWAATYLLIWPEDGKMKKEDVRGIYDGSIFYKKAEEYQKKVEARKRK